VREALRTAASRLGAGPVRVDRLWDRMAREFDRKVAERHVPQAGRIYAFEYTALASFEQARRLGVQAVLDLPSLDSLALEKQMAQELANYPAMVEEHKDHFDALFAPRYERRQREIALADVIIANSSLTARSHIEAGADPAKMKAVPLAGPPPVARIRYPEPRAPLKVLWGSGVTLRKGAHHFMQAWRALDAGQHAQACLYGGLRVPQALLASAPTGVEFRGSVTQAQLFAALAQADVLVFPTLSDGFGMVVSEALAHGVPVIVSDRAGAADRIEHGRNGFVVPAGDPGALKDRLQWCLDNRAALAAMREQAWASAARWQWADYRAAIRAAVQA
jgi:glycosyltransferase involved in cell wall biosynthesis